MTTPKTQAVKKKHPPKFISVPIEILFDETLKMVDVGIFLYIKWKQGKNPDCWPSLRTIAVNLHISVRTVQRGMDRLIRRGRIIRTYPKQSGPGHSCHYSVGNWQPIAEEEQEQRTAFELQLEDEKAKKLAEAINA